jgi:ferredoxin|tara:strand:- start:959 stop:1243 length:285 start_codon:yes stop_codon:yes gene_type:complete
MKKIITFLNLPISFVTHISSKCSSLQHHVMGRVPDHVFEVDEDKCFGCGACIALCPVNVLDLVDRMIIVNEEKCTHCELCIPSCPVSALDIVEN